MIALQFLGGVAVAGHDAPRDSAVPRRRALALLALIAAADPQPIAREKLLALLWPESDTTRARNSLRQTIFALRRDLGEDLFLPESHGGLQLDPAHIRADLWQFRDAIASNTLDDAIAAYRGPFLDGFHVPGLSVFSQWADAERERIERQHVAALDGLARRAHAENRLDDAVAWRRRIAAADPLSAKAGLALLQALADAGDRAGALKHAAAHERLVRQELETEPDPIIAEFVASLRRQMTPASIVSVTPELAPEVAPEIAPATMPNPADATARTESLDTRRSVPSGRRRRKTPAWLTIAAVAVVATGMAGKWVAAAVVGAPRSREIDLGSGLVNSAKRDFANRLVACNGPACPKGSLPIDAYVVTAHPSYAPPSGGAHYIAPVADATSRTDSGYACCTTAVFENAFHLPPDAISATITVNAYADNQAIVALNGREFGRQRNKLGVENFAAFPTRFVTTFVPDPSGTNRLDVTLWDGGGALGLLYEATVTYETEASRRQEQGVVAKER